MFSEFSHFVTEQKAASTQPRQWLSWFEFVQLLFFYFQGRNLYIYSVVTRGCRETTPSKRESLSGKTPSNNGLFDLTPLDSVDNSLQEDMDTNLTDEGEFLEDMDDSSPGINPTEPPVSHAPELGAEMESPMPVALLEQRAPLTGRDSDVGGALNPSTGDGDVGGLHTPLTAQNGQ